MIQFAPSSERTEKAPAPANRAPTWATPRANIHGGKDAYVIHLEMPGVSKDGLDITVEQNELTIVGHRKDGPAKGDLVYRESRSLDYRRSFDLDPSIDTTKITAKIDQGVVTLTLLKAEVVKPRKITVSE